ncbi:RHS repeat-associated core domain-containing protein [Kosakonia sp. SMBL-WEM22]|uniref:RHS repeat-associated core domain-containing protein n=1 Tax=Kosakonia sp. SMBL-WEM22 TaxID=2725560 RepID=UPI001CB91583|nr:RHS repeat-associated core domain-containing protein [Kosakonia sp. SMBL-WEM22]
MTQRFSYDDEHRISRVEIDGDAKYTRAEYRYDALGRRTEKQVWRRHARKPERTQYAWPGLQMVGETSDSHPDAAVQYIRTENSYEPLARVDSHGQHAKIFWYHTERNGLPDSVTDSNGDTVWRGASGAWGRGLRESTPVLWDTPQNQRFQGQYPDRETGLHYITFRYYDPAGGCYTQMDPIGLAGGLNLYAYSPNPLSWIDPLGLSCKSSYSGKLSGKASEMTPLVRGSKAWNQAIKDMQAALSRGEKFQVKLQSSTDAKAFLQEAQGNMNRYKAHTQSARPDGVPKDPKGYEQHMGPEGGFGDSPHIKWYNNGTDGHIFYDIPN